MRRVLEVAEAHRLRDRGRRRAAFVAQLPAQQRRALALCERVGAARAVLDDAADKEGEYGRGRVERVREEGMRRGRRGDERGKKIRALQGVVRRVPKGTLALLLLSVLLRNLVVTGGVNKD